jgi:hypothetical protein
MPIQALLLFCATYFFAILYCNHAFYRDPTSFFFNPATAYEPTYSMQRKHQAESFVAAANVSSLRSFEHAQKPPVVCIGISTIARLGGNQYVRSTIGSLLDGLSNEERQSIHLITFIAHTNPADHPIFHEQWIDKLVDTVLTYNVSQSQLRHLEYLENGKYFQEKSVFDYTYTLRKCHDTGARWIVMLEDDVIAMEGWYSRALQAADQADDATHVGLTPGWLYLRLFYTEEFLGWNAEEWPHYLAWSGLFVLGALVILVTARRQTQYMQKRVSNQTIAIACGLCVPACIVLYFLAGRCSVQPVSPGVFKLPKFGCCSQGLLFNRDMVPRTIGYLQARKEGQIDSMIEDLADEESFVRWAVSPSLLQHVGRKSSRGDDYGPQAKYQRSVAEKIWSFGFETYNSKKRKIMPPLPLSGSRSAFESFFKTSHPPERSSYSLSFFGRLFAWDMATSS